MKLRELLQNSLTPWHTCFEISKAFMAAGYSELDETTPWKLQKSKGYFVQRGGSLAAFLLPKKKPTKAVMVAAHTDAPCLKLKSKGEFERDGLQLLQFESYGAPTLPSWMGRSLVLAGRLFIREKGGKISPVLVAFKDQPFVIPYLAYHLDRKVNESFSCSKQESLVALVGKKLELSTKDIVHSELFATVADAPTALGGSLILSARVDNIVSCYSALDSLLTSKVSEDAVLVSLFLNHEEVGSETQEGAASTFVQDILERIWDKMEFTVEEKFCFKASSKVVSVDVAHAEHPSYPDKSDPRSPARLGNGICIKPNAQQRYAQDGDFLAESCSLWRQGQVLVQSYSQRNDIPSGSTLGPILAAKIGIKCIDVGIPILSMHAAEEIFDEKDSESLTSALKLTFSC